MNTTTNDLKAQRDAIIAEGAAEGFDLTNTGYVHPDPIRRHLEHLREARAYAPQVGDGMTAYYPQDRYPYVITRVSPSGKTVWVKPLRTVSRATGHEPARHDGPFPVWSHTYTDEERATMIEDAAPERQVRRSRDGLSWSMNGTPMGLGAHFHRNYSY